MESTQRIVCNPIDLPYCFQDMTVPGLMRSVQREAADPSLVRYRGRYYLFVSMSGGFWHSPDLADWQFVPTPNLPVLDYAPDVREVDGALVFTASRAEGTCSFWRTTDPVSGVFEEIPCSFAFWDPNLFQDDDGRVYLYWGCSDTEPIRGVELDRATFQPIGEPVPLIWGDLEHRGWERSGEAEGTAAPLGLNQYTGQPARPWVEGAWMTKHAGTYYLQYAAPGTSFNTYGDGYCTSDAPLGPFRYSPFSPFSSAPGGFAAGAGHGSTVQDEHGNWWHASTVRIAVQHPFERRIAIHPAGFDADGVLFCNQEFQDHPMRMPDGPIDPWTGASLGWRLLSHGRPASATSSLADHGPELVVDEDIRTWWVAADGGDEEGVTIDLGDGCTVCAVQVNLADHAIAAAKPAPDVGEPGPTPRMIRVLEPLTDPVRYRVELSADGEQWHSVHLPDDDVRDAPHRLVTLAQPAAARFVRVIGGPGPWGAPLAISGVRAFGHRHGAAPTVAQVVAERLDDRTARVSWQVKGEADGANVRYGSHPDMLYHSWLVHGRTEVVLSTLNADTDYWVAVDSFNGSGVTAGEVLAVTPASSGGETETR